MWRSERRRFVRSWRSSRAADRRREGFDLSEDTGHELQGDGLAVDLSFRPLKQGVSLVHLSVRFFRKITLPIGEEEIERTVSRMGDGSGRSWICPDEAGGSGCG